MADLPMAQIPNFSLGASPEMGPPVQAAIAAGQGVSQSIQAQRTLAQQQAYQQAQIRGQQMQIQAEVQKDRIESGIKMVAAGKDLYDSMGDDGGEYAFAAVKKGLNIAAPGLIPADYQYDPNHATHLKVVSSAAQSYLDGDITYPDFVHVASNEASKAGKVGQDKIKNIIAPVQNVFDQGETTKRIEFEQEGLNKRTAASQTSDLYKQGYEIQNIVKQLNKGNLSADTIALNQAGSVLGIKGPDELKQLAKSGSLGDRAVQAFDKFTGKEGFTPEQRKILIENISSHADTIDQQIQKQSSLVGVSTPSNPTGRPPRQERRVLVKDKSGNHFTVPQSQLKDALDQGYTQ